MTNPQAPAYWIMECGSWTEPDVLISELCMSEEEAKNECFNRKNARVFPVYTAPALSGPLNLERMAEAVHEAYLTTCDRLGWSVKPENQVPYSNLTEDSKELDRASVRAVLASLGEHGTAPALSGVAEALSEIQRECSVNPPGELQRIRCYDLAKQGLAALGDSNGR